MPKSTPAPAPSGLPQANLRLGWRTLLLTMEAQQDFARQAMALWHDLTNFPLPEADGADSAAAFGTPLTGFALGSAQRALRYASGLTTAAIETQTNFNAKLQQAISDWQSECPHGSANPFGAAMFPTGPDHR